MFARGEDGVVELAVHLVGVGIGRGIEHLDDRDPAVVAIVDQLLGVSAGRRLHCCRHGKLLSKCVAIAARLLAVGY